MQPPCHKRPPHTMLYVASAVLIALIGSTGPLTAQQDIPPDFLAQLPRQTVSVTAVSDRLFESLQQIGDDEQRSRALGSLGSLLPLSPEFDQRLKATLEQAIDEFGEPAHVYSLSAGVAHFPDLHAQLLEKIEHPGWRDNIRGVYANHVADLDLARRICAEIEMPVRRRYTLDGLAVRARSLAEMMQLLEEAIAFQPQPDAYTYSGVHMLHKYAASEPRIIADFVARVVPADESIYIYTTLANSAAKDNPAAAKMLMDTAWSRLPETKKPHEHAAFLLERDPREVDRATWVARFDEYILPVLRDAETGINPLYELARFDIELLIDRTQKSCVHPARGFAKIFPKVLEGAFGVNPDAILAFLETTDSQYKDQCVLELVEFQTIPEQIRDPSRQAAVARLGDLVIAVKDPRQRLIALANLSAGFVRSNLPVPERVLAEGQGLWPQHVDVKTLDLWDRETENFFWLGTPRQRKQIIQTQIERLRGAKDYQDRYQWGEVRRFISDSGLPVEEQMALFRDVVTIAEKFSDSYLQARIASSAVNIDAAWAIETIWKILPDDRGRSGKTTYIDWTPPPSDAGDAINWLVREAPRAALSVPLLIALWDFLPQAPPVDGDSIRLALSGSFVQHGQLDAALALAEQIENPAQRSQALMTLLASLKANDRATD